MKDKIKKINSQLEIRSLDGIRFGNATATVVYDKKHYALYHPDYGYVSFGLELDFGIIAPYIPKGGKKALETILLDGGFTSFDGMEWVQPYEKKGMVKTMQLIFKGNDSWSRPVYECDGKLYVDVDPRKGRGPDICTKCNNEFNGEPDAPISHDIDITFYPERMTW